MGDFTLAICRQQSYGDIAKHAGIEGAKLRVCARIYGPEGGLVGNEPTGDRVVSSWKIFPATRTCSANVDAGAR